jgi:DNA-binding PadR family transcriptional regulator
MTPASDPSALLPFSEAVLQILLTLADGPCHGYGIMQDVEERTEGRVRLGPGTLYGAVKRLRQQALIDELDAVDAPEPGDGRRRYYRLTQLGRQAVTLEVERLARLVETARDKKLLLEGTP